MKKFIKLSYDDMDTVIAVDKILSVKARTGTQNVDILLDHVALDAAAFEAPTITVTSSLANTEAKTKEQQRALVAEIGNALETSWTNPIYAVSLPYAIQGITFGQRDFAEAMA